MVCLTRHESVCLRLKEISRWHIEKHLLHLLVRPSTPKVRTVAVADMLLPDGWVGRDSRCYSAGVGEDIRFEKYLTEHLGANVWAFDPTPRSIKFMENAPYDRGKLRFVPVGLWNEDTTLRFYAPSNPAHVSHSVMGQLGGAGYFEAPCWSIVSAMRSLGHDRVDLLKMNIEGAEHVVLDAMLQARILPQVIVLTWEGDNALLKAHRWTKRLHSEGYRFVGRLAWFFTYVRDKAT
jgi:FkbM family methyltransferase